MLRSRGHWSKATSTASSTCALPDPDDRHVLAAAIEAKADLIVTFNAKDFPRRILSAYGIDATRPDAFVLELLARDPKGVYAAARAHRAALLHPPFDVEQYLATLARAGLRRSIEQLRRAVRQKQVSL